MSQWARNNPEQAYREARRADMAMEAYRMAEMEREFQEEPEPEPVKEAIEMAQEQLRVEANECAKGALDEC